MRAAIFVGEGQPLEVEDVTPRPPDPKDVTVQVLASGVCHSDLSIVNGYVPLPPPSILGHEGAGVVLEVGSDVTRVRPGDKIVASFIPGCGVCFYCLHDRANLCDQMWSFSAVPRATRSDGSVATAMTGLGTFSDVMTIHERSVVKVDTDLPAEQLALIGCGVTTGVGAALNTARVEPGSSVAVIGCGGVGTAVIQGARIAGAARIIAVDPVALKRKTAEQLGATDLVDPSQGDPVAQVRNLTSGRGADYAFEVIGLPETINQAFSMARPGGTAVIVGMPRMDATVTFPAWELFGAEKRLLGCVYGSAQVKRDFHRFIGLAETGRLDLGAMVSRRISLDEVNDAFAAMAAGEVIRSVIV
jgi:S-(hydroxymethyl)glutathione dehydrogenase/alcohol dehydrogenase